MTARAATEAVNEAIYNCQIDYWNNNVQLTATAWEAIATSEIGDISNTLDEDFIDFSNNRGDYEIPFSNAELYYGGLYYGLNFATTIFRACEQYDECVLLIIDDLQFYNSHLNTLIDLNGVKMYVVMPNCKDIDQPNCMELREYWDNEFKQYGAIDNDIVYWNGVHIELNLLDELNAIGR